MFLILNFRNLSRSLFFKSHLILVLSVLSSDCGAERSETAKVGSTAAAISSSVERPLGPIRTVCALEMKGSLQNVNYCFPLNTECNKKYDKRISECYDEIAKLKALYEKLVRSLRTLREAYLLLFGKYKKNCVGDEAQSLNMDCTDLKSQIKQSESKLDAAEQGAKDLRKQIAGPNDTYLKITEECRKSVEKIDAECTKENFNNRLGLEIYQERFPPEMKACLEKKEQDCHFRFSFGRRRFYFESRPQDLANARLVVQDTVQNQSKITASEKDQFSSLTEFFFFPRSEPRAISDPQLIGDNLAILLSNGEKVQFATQTLKLKDGVLSEGEINITTKLAPPSIAYKGSGLAIQLQQVTRQSAPTDLASKVIVFRTGFPPCEKVKVVDLFEGRNFKPIFSSDPDADKNLDWFLKTKCQFGFLK